MANAVQTEKVKGALEFIKGIISDTQGMPSSKRLIILTFSLLLGVGYCSNLFYGLQVDKELLDAVVYIVVAGLGVTGFEKFAPATKE